MTFKSVFSFNFSRLETSPLATATFLGGVKGFKYDGVLVLAVFSGLNFFFLGLSVQTTLFILGAGERWTVLELSSG